MALLENKIAIITGAGNGIGRATALLFAREGAKVIVNDVGGPRAGGEESHSAADAVVGEIRKAGGAAEASYDTVATPAGARAIVEKAISSFGRVDVLVNNAGILRDKTLLKLEPADFQAVIENRRARASTRAVSRVCSATSGSRTTPPRKPASMA